MGELIEPQLKEVVEIFLSKYNGENDTNFKWDDDKSYTAESSDKKWTDAIVYDENGKELQIQHKEVIWDPEYDKIRAKAAEKISNNLKEFLRKNDLSEVLVLLNFYQKKIISSNEDVKKFCFYAAEFVNRKLSDAQQWARHSSLLSKKESGQYVYGYDLQDDMLLNEIKGITSYIDIFYRPGQNEPNIGYGYSDLEPRPLPHFGDVVVSEIMEKVINKYDGMITIVNCNRPVDEDDYNLIISQIQNIPFNGQIWMVENFASKKKATCIFSKKNKNFIYA